MTAGFIIAVAVFAGCAFKNAASATSGSTEDTTDLTVPTTIATESVIEETTQVPTPTEEPEPTDDTEATTETTEEPTATPTPKSVKVTFVGDCTLCSDARGYNHFDAVVKKRWDYPFKHCKSIFEKDDLTLANCEMAITSSKAHRKKAFVFAMKPEGTKYFTRASIEAVNLANNHTMDFGQKGYKDTQKNLNKAKILWSDCTHYSIFTAKNGVKIGMCGYTSTYGLSKTYKLIKQLKKKGCQIVIVSCHWGIEATYKPTGSQKSRGHALINQDRKSVV